MNALVPGAVSDWEEWTPDNALENTQRAMEVAQERLGVAPVRLVSYKTQFTVPIARWYSG